MVQLGIDCKGNWDSPPRRKGRRDGAERMIQLLCAPSATLCACGGESSLSLHSSPGLCLLTDGRATEFRQQRLEFLYHGIVRPTVCSDDAVMILRVGRVVAYRLSEQVCEASARFAQDNFGRASVPLFRARAEMYVEVALAL